jgi:hypothetical protein
VIDNEQQAEQSKRTASRAALNWNRHDDACATAASLRVDLQLTVQRLRPLAHARQPERLARSFAYEIAQQI